MSSCKSLCKSIVVFKMFLQYCANIQWISDTWQIHFTSIYIDSFLVQLPVCSQGSARFSHWRTKYREPKKGWAKLSCYLAVFWVCHHFVTRYISIADNLPLKRHYCSHNLTLFGQDLSTGKIHSFHRRSPIPPLFSFSSEQYWRHLASMYLCND